MGEVNENNMGEVNENNMGAAKDGPTGNSTHSTTFSVNVRTSSGNTVVLFGL